jgi:hypothetical protein
MDTGDRGLLVKRPVLGADAPLSSGCTRWLPHTTSCYGATLTRVLGSRGVWLRDTARPGRAELHAARSGLDRFVGSCLASCCHGVSSTGRIPPPAGHVLTFWWLPATSAVD